MADPDYFTLAELRALPDCSDATFTDAQINEAAAFFVDIVEREVGEPFVPRVVVQVCDGVGSSSITLAKRYPTSLTTVTVDDASVDVSDLTLVGGVVRYTSGLIAWPATSPSNVVITYSHGRYATCPSDVKSAVLWATRDRLLSEADNAGIDVRRTSMTTDYGTTNYVLPGENRPTGFPVLDAVIASRKRGRSPLIGS